MFIPRIFSVALFAALALPITIHGATSSDDASSYESSGPKRWMSDAHQGGLNLGRWSLSRALNGGFAGHFVGDSTEGAANINNAGKTFALFANPATSPAPTSTATRRFAKKTMTTGDIVELTVAVNYRNGRKGFVLRDASGDTVFNFAVGRVIGNTGGYYIQAGAQSSFDDGQRLGPYDINTYFSFIFVQRAGSVEWTVARQGGVNTSLSGSFDCVSGTIADIHFYVTGTEAGTDTYSRAANNLYFNNIKFAPATLADQPLTPGERRMPGFVPGYTLRYEHPSPVSTVTVRHSGDNFAASTPMAFSNGVWELDIRSLNLPPGWHQFKFRVDGSWESGENRQLYLDGLGKIAKPPAVYLTWDADPTSTMTIHWHNYNPTGGSLSWRKLGSSDPWTGVLGTSEEFPYSERWIHTARVVGLTPDTEYEFTAEGYSEVFRFKTMPAQLSRPVKFAVGGDVSVGQTADTMTASIASHSPDFIVVGGDLAYADARAENYWKWYRYFESWFHRARTPDGRLIPKLVAIGNHEVYDGLVQNHPDFEPTPNWRLRYAPYFYRCFAFPGSNGFGVVDFGQYLSLVILDTDHTNRIQDQSEWLSNTLAARRGRPHVIPIYHTPAYTSHRSALDAQSLAVKQYWVPLFESAGVKLAFEHHDHTFKVTKPILAGNEASDGIVYVGDGLWGIDSRPPDTSRWYLSAASEQNHVYLITLESAGRTVKAVGLDGQYFGAQDPDGSLVTQSTDEPPPPPSPQLTDMGPGFLKLSWIPVPRASLYRIIRSDGQEFETATAEFTDSGWLNFPGYKYQVVAINRSGEAVSQSPVGPSGRQSWSASYGLPWDGTGAGAYSADPDSDGVLNIAEYFHGSSPVAPGQPPGWKIAKENGDFVVKYRRSIFATEVQPKVLWSRSLGTGVLWSEDGITEQYLGSDQLDPTVEWYGITVPSTNAPPRMFFKMEFEEIGPTQ